MPDVFNDLLKIKRDYVKHLQTMHGVVKHEFSDQNELVEVLSRIESLLLEQINATNELSEKVESLTKMGVSSNTPIIEEKSKETKKKKFSDDKEYIPEINTKGSKSRLQEKKVVVDEQDFSAVIDTLDALGDNDGK